MQISPSVNDPDRGCKVACQDEYIAYRFYLVNGEQGYFPFGTKCSRADNDHRYCVNGKCLEFDANDIPLVEPQISLAHYRTKRTTSDAMNSRVQQTHATPTLNATNDLLTGFLHDVEQLKSHLNGNISTDAFIDCFRRLQKRFFLSGTIDAKQIDMRTPIVQTAIHH